MVTFIHTADWQIGKSFTGSGLNITPDLANDLREARLDTARDVMNIARDEDVDFVVIAGDLFEDEFVERSLRVEVHDILTEDGNPPVYLVAGNHDPIRTECVYHQSPFNRTDGALYIPEKPSTYNLPGDEGVLLTSPLTEKKSTEDPSGKFPDSSSENIRIGVTHGQLAVGDMQNPDAHPINRNAVEEHDLDYLALGDWHTHFRHPDHPNRCRYSGTHEKGKFEDDAGVLLVEIDEPGADPNVEYRKTGRFQWESLEEIDLTPDGALDSFRNRLDEMDTSNTLLQLKPEGTLNEQKARIFRDLLKNVRERFAHLEVDESKLYEPVAVQTLLNQLGSEELLTGAVADLLWLKTKMTPNAAGEMQEIDTSSLPDQNLEEIFENMKEQHEPMDGEGTDPEPEDIDRAIQELHQILQQQDQ